MAIVFYLKYRPQKFSDLDSTEAREQLEKVFASGKIPHAFLFSGPRGIGKTSAARIVAKAVNCEQHSHKVTKQQSKISEALKLGSEAADEALKLSYEPCNECDSCISITNGTNLDVFEIDAASNRGIDDIKELRDKIKLAPASARFKVYIIDEVHMLTNEAFNALLKTLEEPPPHAIFVLCTTDPEKLPKTITSRCQRINFKKATKKEIIGKLKRIAKEEELGFEDKALEEIAKLSDGSFRDANKIFEACSLLGKVTEEEVKKTAGILGEFRTEDFLLFLKSGEIKEALLWINRASEDGADLKLLTEKIVFELRRLLLANLGIEEADLEPDLEAISFSKEEIKILIDLFSKAYSVLRSAVIPQLPLEMAVVEWGETWKLEVGSGKLDKEGRSEKEEPDKRSQNQKITLQNPASHVTSPTSFSLNDVLPKWPEILEKVKPLNHSVLAFLKASRPVGVDNNFLTLEVFYKFHKDQLETEKCRRIFEKAASEVLNCEVKLKCDLSKEKPAKSVAKEPLPEPKVADSQDADIIKMAEEIFNK